MVERRAEKGSRKGVSRGGKVVLLGRGPYLRNLKDALEAIGFGVIEGQSIKGIVPHLSDAHALVFEPEAPGAQKLEIATSAPRIAILPTASVEVLDAFLRKGVVDVIGSEHVDPTHGAIVVVRSVLDAQRREREQKALRGALERSAASERRSMTDKLTGLYSRRCAETRLGAACERAQREQLAMGVILLDVDKFKRINDSFGHVVGDLVLQGVARHLKTELRLGDILGRWGGDEFMVVMPATDIESARACAERIVANIRDRRIVASHKDLEVTISAGVCSAQGSMALDPKSLVRCADELLYRAKHAGGDRVVADLFSTSESPS